jgi:hypothetical protein
MQERQFTNDGTKPTALGNQGLWLHIVEIEDQQYPCSNKDFKCEANSGCFNSWPSPSAGWKAGHYCIMFIVLHVCSEVCAQDGNLEFQKHFHYTEANAVKLSTFQWPHNVQNTLYQI